MKKFLTFLLLLSAVSYSRQFSTSDPRDPTSAANPVYLSGFLCIMNHATSPAWAGYLLYYDDRLKTMAIKIQPNDSSVSLVTANGGNLYIFENDNPKLFSAIKDECEKSIDSWYQYFNFYSTSGNSFPVRGKLAFHYKTANISINGTAVPFNVIIGIEIRPAAF